LKNTVQINKTIKPTGPFHDNENQNNDKDKTEMDKNIHRFLFRGKKYSFACMFE